MNPVRLILAAAILLTTLSPSTSLAQSTSVSSVDSRRVDRILRDVTRDTLRGTQSIQRADAGTQTLLTRLAARAASDDRLLAVGTHYKRSVTAIRVRQTAIIDRRVTPEINRLRGLNQSETLIADLQAARDEAVAEMISEELVALASIDASVADAQASN